MKTIAKLLGLGLVLLALYGCNRQPEKRPFITKWQGEAGETIKIAAIGTYTLTWYNEATPNERHTQQVTVHKESDVMGTYIGNPYAFTTPTNGVYIVEVGPEGVDEMRMYFFEGASENASRLLSVVQFGDVVWKKLEEAFIDCSNLQFEKDIDVPNLSQCTSLARMFEKCSNFNSPLEDWDVSAVTDMNNMFCRCSAFNQPLNGWNVGKVRDMSGLFYGCERFNQPLDKWDVSAVTDMNCMFQYCSAFNQPLNGWNVGNVLDMSGMFCGCEHFNQPLDRWDVSAVTDMALMFAVCSAFNQPLNEWNVGQVETINNMFVNCQTFNQPLDKWNVTQVTNMSQMFDGCTSFKQSLDAWDINNVPKEDGMKGIFHDCPAGELTFVKKWEAEGYNLDLDEDEL